MDEDQLKAILSQTEETLKKQGEEMMEGYVAQYQALAAKAAEDMKRMVVEAQKKTEEATKAEVVHMKWMEVNGQNVLVLSEQAGTDIFNAFDVLGRLLPQLKKALKGK